MSWKDLKIAKKLYFGFATVLVCTCAAGWVAISGFTKVHDTVGDLQNTNSLVRYAKDLGIFRRDYTATNKEELADKIDATIKDMEKLVSELIDDHRGKPEEQKMFTTSQSLLSEWAQKWNQYHSSHASMKNNSSSAASAMAEAVEVEMLKDLVGTNKEFVASLDVAYKDQENKVTAIQAEAKTLATIFAIAAILVGVVVAFFIARGISRPISRIAAVANDISKGDIQQTIDFQQKDEIGQLADSFKNLINYMKYLAGAAEAIASNNLTVKVEPKSSKDVLGNSFKIMTENLTAMVRQMADNSRELVSAATEIASSAEQMSKGAANQSNQVNQVAAAVQEMTANIVESSKNASDAADTSKSASAQATTGGQIVAESINGMQKIATVVRESAESIAKLAKSADQIGEIIGVIDDIADQTNLLALNAAIEAARAGEQGRGFAVVADEVRKLAERTGKATGEITQMIKGIQTETNDAVHSMEAGIQQVDHGRELTDKAGASLNEIVTMSGRVLEMIKQIAAASEEQSSAAEQISKNIEQITSVTQETAKGAEQSAAAAEQLNRQAEGLQTMVARFKV
jgi:methyl-accepting chemotaxis protein